MTSQQEIDDALRGPEPDAPGPLWAIPLLIVGAIAALAISWAVGR